MKDLVHVLQGGSMGVAIALMIKAALESKAPTTKGASFFPSDRSM